MERAEDLSLRVARGETLVSLVDYILESDRAGRRWPEVRDVLVERFALSYDGARLALDRVEGGKTRASTGAPENEPDRALDPVAWISYQRALGRPVEGPPPADLREASRRAKELITRSFKLGRMQGTDDVDVALMVTKLAVARVDEAPTETDAKNLLVLAATALSTAIEAQIDARDPRGCAPEGSQAWVDGVELAAASRQITQEFAARGWHDLAQRGLDLCGRAVTGLLGQCRARVGAVMLARIRSARAADDDEMATQLCEAVIADFEVLVHAWEGTTEAPFDEERIALEHLVAVLDELVAIHGESRALRVAPVRARCAAVLERAASAEA